MGINYSSFKKFGKEVHLLFGEPILKEHVDNHSEGKFHLDFNGLLASRLGNLVYEIDGKDVEKRKSIFSIKMKTSLLVLLVPGIIGMLIHLPFYLPIKLFTELRFKKSGHYDSVVASLLILLYPFYLLLMFLILLPLSSPSALLLFVLLPLFARCALEVKYQFDY